MYPLPLAPIFREKERPERVTTKNPGITRSEDAQKDRCHHRLGRPSEFIA